MTLATVVCAAATLALVLAEVQRVRALRVAAKTVASLAFVLVGAHALGDARWTSWMFWGLVLGAIGDVCLLGRGSRAFLAGLGAFLAGHLAYVAGIAAVEPPARWLADAGVLAAPPVVLGLGALAYLWPRLGALAVPVIVYIGAIVAMVVAAVAAARGGAVPAPHGTWLAAGAALFFVSDLAVARERFVARGLANKLWGLPAYYAGQLLIAWSLATA